MLKSFRKHKKILLLLSGLILIVILTLMVMSQNKNSKFSDVNLTPDSITKIHIRMMAPTDNGGTERVVLSGHFLCEADSVHDEVIISRNDMP